MLAGFVRRIASDTRALRLGRDVEEEARRDHRGAKGNHALSTRRRDSPLEPSVRFWIPANPVGYSGY